MTRDGKSLSLLASISISFIDAISYMFLSSMLTESAIVGLLQIFLIQYRIKMRTNNVNILYVSISLVCLIDSKRDDIFFLSLKHNFKSFDILKMLMIGQENRNVAKVY